MALYAYDSPQSGDLTFREGDVILVSKREGEWWNGSIGNRTGVFPSNYVKPKETDVRTLKITHKRGINWSAAVNILCRSQFTYFLSFLRLQFVVT